MTIYNEISIRFQEKTPKDPKNGDNGNYLHVSPLSEKSIIVTKKKQLRKVTRDSLLTQRN